MKVTRKIAIYFFLVALIIWPIFYFEDDLYSAWKGWRREFSPCGKAIAYSVGELDGRFAISQSLALAAAAEAEKIWEKAAGRELFNYSAGGGLKINFIYDDRQDSTVKLKNLGFDISKNKASYESLKEKHETTEKIFRQRKDDLDKTVSYYHQAKEDYEAEVKAANRRGEVTPDEYKILEQERNDLNNLASSIKAKQEATNKIVDQLNALANVLNRLIYELNLEVKNYNTIGAEAAGEFQEGAYISDNTGEKINIYQFDDRAMLARVLAHELGHALGLEHLDNPDAIMYRLNESGNEKITEDDLSELRSVCKLK